MGDTLLDLQYLEYHQRYNDLIQAGVSEERVNAEIMASDLASVGKMGKGAGFFAMEKVVSKASIDFVFSKSKVVKTITTESPNYSTFGKTANMQTNLEKGDVGLMYKKTTYCQSSLDAFAGSCSLNIIYILCLFNVVRLLFSRY